MLIDKKDGRQLVNELAYQMVYEIAPEELPLYVYLRDYYFADPDKYFQTSESADEALAFGSVEAIQTFTYVVFPLITPILTYIIDEVKKTLKDEAGEKAVQWVRSLLKPQDQPQALFTQAQLAAIEVKIDEIVNEETRRLGLKKTQATAMKNAIITKLALAGNQ